MKLNTTLCIAVLIAGGILFSISNFYATPPGGDSAAVDAALHTLGYTTIRLRKTVANEFEVNATLNGNKPITLLINFQTGNSLFNTKRLEDLGIEFEKTGQEFEINGDRDNVAMLRTDSIAIGEARIGPEEIMSVDFDEFRFLEDYRVTGIIGRDFLIKYNALFDFANQKLYLKTN